MSRKDYKAGSYGNRYRDIRDLRWLNWHHNRGHVDFVDGKASELRKYMRQVSWRRVK